MGIDPVLSLSTVKFLTAEFKRDRIGIFDEYRPGRPYEVTSLDIIRKIHDNDDSGHLD